MSFLDRLESLWGDGRFVCVGLDVDLSRVPETVAARGVRERIVDFNRTIVEATHDLVAAYKPNIGFYERYGTDGLEALRETVQVIKTHAPATVVVLDAKRGDIGETSKAYAQACFDHFNADAVTVHPYLGREAIQPFLDYADRGVFVLCRTSNPGAHEFQDLVAGGRPLYEVVAEHVRDDWNGNRNCGLVVGATYPGELRDLRGLCEDLPFLVPGVGAQGGDARDAVDAGTRKSGGGILLNSSRGIIYASRSSDYAGAARQAVVALAASAG